jgi:hypothetical protein
MCGQGLLVIVWQARMFCHIDLQTITTEISSYMICQSLEDAPLSVRDECGACAMVLRHILAALCEMLPITPIMTDGYVVEDPLHGLYARQI